jgi:hypothetical protein
MNLGYGTMLHINQEFRNFQNLNCCHGILTSFQEVHDNCKFVQSLDHQLGYLDQGPQVPQGPQDLQEFLDLELACWYQLDRFQRLREYHNWDRELRTLSCPCKSSNLGSKTSLLHNLSLLNNFPCILNLHLILLPLLHSSKHHRPPRGW